MSGIFRQSFDDTNNAQETELLGGTDQTKIGNVGDRLKVDASISVSSLSVVSAWSKKLRYDNMSAIARGTSITAASGWNTVYTYTGSGNLISLILNLETMTDWYVRIVVDGEELFSSAGIFTNDLTTDIIYDLDDSGKSADEGLGVSHGIFCGAHDTFHWKAPLSYPVGYASSVSVLVSRKTGAAAKKFQAGLIILSKET